MRKILVVIILFYVLSVQLSLAQQNEYTNRFLQLRTKLYDPANGYFSKDGVPYHSSESLIVEAPDHGHTSTSEAYSYWIWLEAMYGRIQKDWTPLNSAWTKMEAFAIPTPDQQPTAGGYNPNAPATYAAEHPLPSGYPSPLQSGVPVGRDPLSPELTATYGNANVYGMHWLFDLDNFYGYGNKGDGVSTPSYINTFQRGVQESVWETVPHPSWDNFKWGADDGSGFMKLFVKETTAPAAQWRYTNAPDADARVVQAMYWATQFAKEQGLNPATVMPLDKTKKMGDYLRLSFFDKYFKPIGSQSLTGPGGTGYESAHYLMSWYYAWGGPLVSQGWAWRIGCSHNHFGYQNPVAAYALSAVPELKPISPNGVRDWNISLNRQMEFYQWLQSAEGAIAGGATNSWNGKYDPYPAGTPTFYGMAYVANPVYEDPGSNTWFGMQAWSMERVAELYYMSGNARAKAVLDKWIPWVKSVTRLTSNGSYEIPAEIGWTGKPNTWNAAAPTPNTGLHVVVVNYNQDIGIAACLAKALIYYAAATQKYGTLDTQSRDLAKAILDRMWANYYDPAGKGVSVPEVRKDFKRFFEQEVFIPAGWTGKMANGDVIKPGVKFIDIRSKYKQDPDWPALQAAYTSGTDYVKKYHRFWAQVDVALANAEYGRFFVTPTPNDPPVVTATATPTSGAAPLAVAFTATATDPNAGDVLTYSWVFGDNTTGTGATPSKTYTAAGVYNAIVTVVDGKGGTAKDTVVITVTGNRNPTVTATATPTTGTAPLAVSLRATGSDPDGDALTYSWAFGDATTGTGAVVSHTYTAAGIYNAVVTASDGRGGSATATVRITVTGNRNPTVTATATPSSGAAPLAVSLRATGSDPDGDALTYSWAFGDNTTGTGAVVSHTYATAGIYNAVVTASDGRGGSATGTVRITVTGPNRNPTVTVTATPTSGAAPLAVSFTATGSDLDGDALTYSWTFGNGLTATGAIASTTYTTAAPYVATVTVSDGRGGSGTASVTITATGGGFDCAFGAPQATALATRHGSYSKAHVIGTGGPNLSNVTNFVINWDLQNRGLWQFSFNTNNGVPNWYIDLRSKMVHTFTQAQPGVTFSGTGIAGLDNAYWATFHNGNFVLAAKNGSHTIYFSSSATPPACGPAVARTASADATSSALSVYPNPSQTGAAVYLSLADLPTEGTISVTVSDPKGVRVFSKVVKNEKSILLDADLYPGLYTIRVITASGDTFYKKVAIR